MELIPYAGKTRRGPRLRYKHEKSQTVFSKINVYYMGKIVGHILRNNPMDWFTFWKSNGTFKMSHYSLPLLKAIIKRHLDNECVIKD